MIKVHSHSSLLALVLAASACSSTSTKPDEDESEAGSCPLADAGPDATQTMDAPTETSVEAATMDQAAPDGPVASDSGDAASPADGGDAASPADGGDAASPIEAAVTSVLPALPGYTVSVWATGGAAYKGPDALELDGTHVWVGYQMGVKNKDGTDGGGPLYSKVVQYNLADGSLTGKSFTIPGHCDGVRVDPATHIVWASSNEDGSPVMMSYDPSNDAAAPVLYTLPDLADGGTLLHGGGLDDMAFFNGQFIVADSAPSLDVAGNNTSPALSVVHVSGTNITFTPFLAGTPNATDLLQPADAGLVKLNLTDPDSLTIDSSGNLVLVDQADSQLVFVSPSDAGGKVSRLSVGTQLDDTVWATRSTGMLLVADAAANTIYAIHATSGFTAGTVYTESPNDSGVSNFVGTVDLTTGFINPIAIGFKKATGLIFVPQ